MDRRSHRDRDRVLRRRLARAPLAHPLVLSLAAQAINQAVQASRSQPRADNAAATLTDPPSARRPAASRAPRNTTKGTCTIEASAAVHNWLNQGKALIEELEIDIRTAESDIAEQKATLKHLRKVFPSTAKKSNCKKCGHPYASTEHRTTCARATATAAQQELS